MGSQACSSSRSCSARFFFCRVTHTLTPIALTVAQQDYADIVLAHLRNEGPPLTFDGPIVPDGALDGLPTTLGFD